MNTTTESSIQWTAPLNGNAVVRVVVSDGKGGQVDAEWSIEVGTFVQGTWYGERLNGTWCRITVGDVLWKGTVESEVNYNTVYTFYEGTLETSVVPDRVFQIVFSDIPFDQLGKGSELNPGWYNVMYQGNKTKFSVVASDSPDGKEGWVVTFHTDNFLEWPDRLDGLFAANYDRANKAYTVMTLYRVEEDD